MRLLWQVIANFAATCRYGYTSVTFAPRGQNNLEKSAEIA